MVLIASKGSHSFKCITVYVKHRSGPQTHVTFGVKSYLTFVQCAITFGNLFKAWSGCCVLRFISVLHEPA